MDLELIAFIKDSDLRFRILKELEKKPQLPSELAKKLNINRASISRTLKVLKEKELVIPKSSGGRTIIYSISEKGKKLISDLNAR